MLLPKHAKGKGGGGGGWKAAATSRIPPLKTVVTFLTRSRVIYLVVVLVFLMLWRTISGRASHGIDRFVPTSRTASRVLKANTHASTGSTAGARQLLPWT